MKYIYLLVLTGLFCRPLPAQEWQSRLLSVENDGTLSYHQDEFGFVIPDFSHAGYKNGMPIPTVEMPEQTVWISPLPDEDNTERIQAAIDEVGAYPLDEKGFRGLVFFQPGKYIVRGSIRVPYDGVILRGSGREEDPLTSTILYCDNAIEQDRNIVYMGSPSANNWGNGDGELKTTITQEKVMPGDLSFEVESTAGYAEGDLICIKYPTSESWLSAVQYGGNSDAGKKWQASQIDISYHRYIRKIEGNTITVDAPVFYCLDRQYNTPYVYRIPENKGTARILHRVGIENMRIEFTRTSAQSSSKADQNCVMMCSLENSWAKGLYLTGFIHAGIKTQSVTRSTIEDCHSMKPSGLRTGSNQYNFETYQRSQLILFKDCKAEKGRHHFIANGTASNSGIVVLRMASTDDMQDGIAEGHRLWTQGILFDNWVERGTRKIVNRYKLGMYLRRDEGSGHGWSGTNSFFWNCDIEEGGIYLDKPPTGQNYAIGCTAKYIKKHYDSSAYTTGYVEGQNSPGLVPGSLYEAQLTARLDPGNSSLDKQETVREQVVDLVVSTGNIHISSRYPGTISLYTIDGIKVQSLPIQVDDELSLDVVSRMFYIVSFDSPSYRFHRLIHVP